MEDMLNSSDTSRNRVAVSFNDSDSEEKFEEPLMEEISDDCNFIIPQPKYSYNKRHKLAATRDFPDGCGPYYAPRIDDLDNSFGETIESSLEDVEVTKRAAKVVKCEQNNNAVTRKRKWKNKNDRRKCFYCARVLAVKDFPGNGSDLEKGLVGNYVEGDDVSDEGNDVIESCIANSESEENNSD